MKSNCAFHIHAFYLASSVEIKKARRGEILNIWLHDMNLIKMWHYKLGFCLFLPQQKLQPPRINHQNVAGLNKHTYHHGLAEIATQNASIFLLL